LNTRIPEQYVKSGKIAREVRQWILGNVRAGSGLLDVAEKIEAEIVRRGGQPAFPTGMGVNEVTAHYAPQESDVVKIDYGVHIDGYIADTSITITENPQYQSLLEATEKALQAAIDVVKRDKRIGEIGKAISSVAEREGYRPINNLSGHTVEQYQVHAGKSIPNLYAPNLPMLKNADVFAIEPFLTLPDAAGYVIEGPQVNIFSLIVRRKTGNKEDAPVLAPLVQREVQGGTSAVPTQGAREAEARDLLRDPGRGVRKAGGPVRAHHGDRRRRPCYPDLSLGRRLAVDQRDLRRVAALGALPSFLGHEVAHLEGPLGLLPVDRALLYCVYKELGLAVLRH
jgi:methionyl aminopeptidase